MRIGLFAEGYTDQLLIESVIVGVLGGEAEVNFVQPLSQGPNTDGAYAPGGWTVLFDALRRGEHKKALQFNDIIMIHVDTDVCDEVGFDVSKVADPEELAKSVEDRLWDLMGEEFRRAYGHRVVFAIAVDEVECWLMPMLFLNLKGKRSKTTGCLEAANDELRRRGQKVLSHSTGKDPKAYYPLARALSDPKDLALWASRNPSLGRFVETLKCWPWQAVMESPQAAG